MGNSGSASKCNFQGLSNAGLCLFVLLCHYDATVLAKPQVGALSRPLGGAGAPYQASFKAAVYEHAPVMEPDISEAVAANLKVFWDQAWLAAAQGADILVFPEYGLTGLGQSRSSLKQVSEQVPQPLTHQSRSSLKLNSPVHQSSPCQEATEDTPIQVSLSCMARDAGLYVAANMISQEPCSQETDPECPPDGVFLYNANVVYDREGLLVAYYRKWTLYYENNINQPEKVDLSYFDTPFGRIGTFICFDILFEKPAIELINDFAVDTILFPTAWQSKLPLMQGLGFHESWAILNGANLLGSQLHVPLLQFSGSGLYAGANGVANYFKSEQLFSPSKLIVAELLSKPLKPTDIKLPPVKVLDGDYDTFNSIMRRDNYTFVALIWNSNEIYLTSWNTSCYLNYQFHKKLDSELYAFGIFQGLHLSAHNSYLQVCALVKCGTPNDLASCGDTVRSASSVFDFVTIHGQFSSHHVYPSVIIDGGVPTGNKSGWNFVIDSANDRALIDVMSESKPLVYTTLYGRLYDSDTEKFVVNVPGGSDKLTLSLLVTVLPFAVLYASWWEPMM